MLNDLNVGVQCSHFYFGYQKRTSSFRATVFYNALLFLISMRHWTQAQTRLQIAGNYFSKTQSTVQKVSVHLQNIWALVSLHMFMRPFKHNIQTEKMVLLCAVLLLNQALVSQIHQMYFPCPGITAGSACHEKRSLHEAPGKSAKMSGTKVCPYSHPSSQNSSGSSAGNPLSTSADLCKTTPKHFKTMCRRPTPPGNVSIDS